VPVTRRDGCLSRSFSYSMRIRSSMNFRVASTKHFITRNATSRFL